MNIAHSIVAPSPITGYPVTFDIQIPAQAPKNTRSQPTAFLMDFPPLEMFSDSKGKEGDYQKVIISSFSPGFLYPLVFKELKSGAFARHSWPDFNKKEGESKFFNKL